MTWIQRLPRLDTREPAACPKPKHGAIKAATRTAARAFTRARSVFRALIFRLDGGRCRRCKRKLWLKPSEAPHEFAIGHVHEWEPRSQGGDPLDRCNCLLLCCRCHELVTTNTVEIVAVDETRMMRGLVDFVRQGQLE